MAPALVVLLVMALAAFGSALLASPRARRSSARRRRTGEDAPPAWPLPYGSGGHPDGD